MEDYLQKILQAKERFIELKSEHEKVIFQREKKISEVESRLREKENKLNNELNRNKNLSHSLEQKNEFIRKRLDKLDRKQKEIDISHKIQIEKLETISGISADDAKNQLKDSLKKKEEILAQLNQGVVTVSYTHLTLPTKRIV